MVDSWYALPWLNQVVTFNPSAATEQILGASQTSVAALAVAMSFIIFVLTQILTARAARKERQRKVIEDWFRTLSKWVDDYSSPTSEPKYDYHQLASRQVIELSLSRKNRYLAWWMHEMAMAIMMRRVEASKDPESAPKARADLDMLLTDVGEYLLAWHHGELKSSDFHIPYQLHLKARIAEVDVQEYAEKLKLSPFINPVRMNRRRSWLLQKLMFRPETGSPILAELQQFLKVRYAIGAVLYSVPSALVTRVRLALLQRRLARTQRRLERLQNG